MRTLHPTYDYYKYWPTAYERPQAVNVEAYQKKIDDIMGTTLDGKPIVRLIWSWDSREWIAGEWRAKYRHMTVTVPGGIVDICPPRWILEERNEPGQYWDAWEAGRYFTVPETGETIDLRGAPPREGWYSYLDLVADHAEGRTCCDHLFKEEQRRCWGFYREPSQEDLDMLARAKQLRDADKYVDPNKPLSPEVLAELGRNAFTRNEKLKIARRHGLEDQLASAMAPHLHRIETVWDDTKQQLVIRETPDGGKRRERFHFLR